MLLRAIGLGSLARGWLADENTALLAVIAVPIWHTIGYFFVILLAAMRNVPREIYEAARIDGAGARVTFTRITVPDAVAGAAGLRHPGDHRRAEELRLRLRHDAGRPGHRDRGAGHDMYKTIFVSLQIGYGTAMATVIFLVGAGHHPRVPPPDRLPARVMTRAATPGRNRRARERRIWLGGRADRDRLSRARGARAAHAVSVRLGAAATRSATATTS